MHFAESFRRHLDGDEGADVTHPRDRMGSEPSIAAVTGSTNVYWTRYAAKVEVLGPDRHIGDVRLVFTPLAQQVSVPGGRAGLVYPAVTAVTWYCFTHPRTGQDTYLQWTPRTIISGGHDFRSVLWSCTCHILLEDKFQ